MMEEARWTARSLPLPEAGGEARLLVCEATGGWAIALRRELAGLRLRVHETRSVVEAWAELARAPASFLVVELSRASVEPFLERLAWLEQDYPLARVAVVAERALEDCEWLVRADTSPVDRSGPDGLPPSPDGSSISAESGRRNLGQPALGQGAAKERLL